jgi:hypothetical protein
VLGTQPNEYTAGRREDLTHDCDLAVLLVDIARVLVDAQGIYPDETNTSLGSIVPQGYVEIACDCNRWLKIGVHIHEGWIFV